MLPYHKVEVLYKHQITRYAMHSLQRGSIYILQISHISKKQKQVNWQFQHILFLTSLQKMSLQAFGLWDDNSMLVKTRKMPETKFSKCITGHCLIYFYLVLLYNSYNAYSLQRYYYSLWGPREWFTISFLQGQENEIFGKFFWPKTRTTLMLKQEAAFIVRWEFLLLWKRKGKDLLG